jgi:hypothetical protein
VAKSKKTNSKKQTAKRSWNARLKELGLPELKPGFIPRRRRAEPLLDEHGNELERGARLNLDRSSFVAPEETEYRPAVTPGAFFKLAECLNLSSVARTVLGMRLLTDATREDVRAFYLREHPLQVGEAMSAWRELFSRRMPEIRAFLAGYRQDREVPAKPRYRLSE